MNSLLLQLKKRRLALGLKQNDMLLRAGIARQQYQRLEARGNPRLDTLELIAQGLQSELMLTPNEKLSAVRAVLESTTSDDTASEPSNLADNPWQGLLGDTE